MPDMFTKFVIHDFFKFLAAIFLVIVIVVYKNRLFQIDTSSKSLYLR